MPVLVTLQHGAGEPPRAVGLELAFDARTYFVRHLHGGDVRLPYELDVGAVAVHGHAVVEQDEVRGAEMLRPVIATHPVAGDGAGVRTAPSVLGVVPLETEAFHARADVEREGGVLIEGRVEPAGYVLGDVEGQTGGMGRRRLVGGRGALLLVVPTSSLIALFTHDDDDIIIYFVRKEIGISKLSIRDFKYDVVE